MIWPKTNKSFIFSNQKEIRPVIFFNPLDLTASHRHFALLVNEMEIWIIVEEVSRKKDVPFMDRVCSNNKHLLCAAAAAATWCSSSYVARALLALTLVPVALTKWHARNGKRKVIKICRAVHDNHRLLLFNIRLLPWCTQVFCMFAKLPENLIWAHICLDEPVHSKTLEFLHCQSRSHWFRKQQWYDLFLESRLESNLHLATVCFC